jgi:hypothetical protein|tara:strand:- start:415 stop:720 length:306 start_codon:yes stop_codon:yes gene_type:complete
VTNKDRVWDDDVDHPGWLNPTVPKQSLFVGDLVRMEEDKWPHLKKGQHGFITLARCDKVCVKGGVNPEYAMEWAYVGRFDMNTCPQGVRLSRLDLLEVISD